MSDHEEAVDATLSKSTEDEEPASKKIKTKYDDGKKAPPKLEERLNGILCCAVCLDLPPAQIYQCCHGHLICASCHAHLLADARLKDEGATCPNCRCDITKNACSRNLAVEKAISELPGDCLHCGLKFSRVELDFHMRNSCPDRPVNCKYEKIGCQWRGPFHELEQHIRECLHPIKNGEEILPYLLQVDKNKDEKIIMLNNIVKMLSYENVSFCDIQLRPFRSEDFLTKLFYESSRFTALDKQWAVKANVNDDQKFPERVIDRCLGVQLIVKTKLTAPFNVYYFFLPGPHSNIKDMKVDLKNFEFGPDTTETCFTDLSLNDNMETNKLLSAKSINLRIVFIQVPIAATSN